MRLRSFVNSIPGLGWLRVSHRLGAIADVAAAMAMPVTDIGAAMHRMEAMSWVLTDLFQREVAHSLVS